MKKLMLLAAALSLVIMPAYAALQKRLQAASTAQKRIPVASSLDPASTTVGIGVSLLVSGSNFTNSSVLTWNQAAQPTTYVSASQLMMTVSPGMVSSAGTSSVSVYTPGRNGGTSAALLFSVVAPPPPPPPPSTIAELPRYTIETAFPDTSGYVRKTVCTTGCDYSTVQEAVNDIPAVGGNINGEVIALAAGETFYGNIQLPAYLMAENKWIIITTDSNSLPAPGVRVTPDASSSLAKLITRTVNVPAVEFASSANHYWLMGLEIAVDPSLSLFEDATVKMGAVEGDASILPHHIMIDRCFIHGTPTGNSRRGVEADGIYVGVINSWISDYHDTGADTQAIWAYNTPGPLLIHNNYLEAAGENVMFGAATPLIPGSVPSDITITKNHFFKPLTWLPSDPSFAGIRWSVKNLFEIKNARRVLLRGNVFENCWASAQTGWAMVFTPRSAFGTCPWCTNEDITIEYNMIRRAGNGIGIQSTDDIVAPSLPTQRMSIQNNLFSDISHRWGGEGSGILLQIIMPFADPTARDIIFNHNTAIHSGHALVGGESANPMVGFVFSNNIAAFNVYGIVGSGVGTGNLALDAYFPGGGFVRNYLANTPDYMLPRDYPADNFYLRDWNDLSFVDIANCTSGNFTAGSLGVCALAPGSSYLTSGTDGKPIGADIPALIEATSGVAP